jgi:CBS domain containing-hemolysin-like protein
MTISFIVVGLCLSCAILLTALGASLRYLNFSQLKNVLTPEDYESLVEPLKKRDDIEIFCWFLGSFFSLISIAMFFFLFSMKVAWDLEKALGLLFFLSIILAAWMHVAPLLFLAPWAEKILLRLMFLYRFLGAVPLVLSFIGWMRRSGQRVSGEKEDESLSLEMDHLVMEGQVDGTVKDHETSMIRKVMALKDTAVKDVMTPRAKLLFLNESDSVDRGILLAAEHGLSRLPIYDSETDQVKGVFFVRDALEPLGRGEDIRKKPVEEMMRQVPLVPETRNIGTLLNMMAKSRNQMLIVLDEYGGVCGVVTLEDILEEIVGEIRDEYADEEMDFHSLETGHWLVKAGARIEDLNEALDLKLPEDPVYETLAGYLLSKIQRIPKSREEFVFEHLKFTIIKATHRRIEQVEIQNIKKGTSHS